MLYLSEQPAEVPRKATIKVWCPEATNLMPAVARSRPLRRCSAHQHLQDWRQKSFSSPQVGSHLGNICDHKHYIVCMLTVQSMEWIVLALAVWVPLCCYSYHYATNSCIIVKTFCTSKTIDFRAMIARRANMNVYMRVRSNTQDKIYPSRIALTCSSILIDQ